MENLTAQEIPAPPNWEPAYDGEWKSSDQYKALVAKQEAETIPPEIVVEEGDITVEIPLHRIRHLVDRGDVITVKVHGKPILINKVTLCEMAGNIPFERINLQSVIESLEENLAQEEVEEFRKAQTRSVSLGSEYRLEDHILNLDINEFKVRTPSLASKLKVEIADQDFDLEGFSMLNGVKPEFKDLAKGLRQVVRTPVAAHILNLIQEQDPKQEMAFYTMLLDRLDSDANTFTFGLGMMRHLMQYALNVDTLQVKSILTEEFVNKGEQS